MFRWPKLVRQVVRSEDPSSRASRGDVVAGRVGEGGVELRFPGAASRLHNMGALSVNELHERNCRVDVGTYGVNAL